PVFHCGFVTFDDGTYVAQNQRVQAGLSWPGIIWAFTTTWAANWHPLTWLSHMTDASLFGAGPAGPHGVNLVFHLGNSILLFLLLRAATGCFWRSGIVAAFFALHPLRVESVAWISERKDVLSAFFGLLAMFCYVGYCQARAEIPESGSIMPWRLPPRPKR